MKAICLRARGGPEALAYEEAPQPHPGEGEVLVRVHAAGVIHTELLLDPDLDHTGGRAAPVSGHPRTRILRRDRRPGGRGQRRGRGGLGVRTQ